MSYSSTNPAKKIAGTGMDGGGSLWAYESTHVHSIIEGVGFFAGCGFGSPGNNAIGMRVGDLLIAVCQATSGTSAVTMHRVTAISSSTGWGGGLHASVSAASS